MSSTDPKHRDLVESPLAGDDDDIRSQTYRLVAIMHRDPKAQGRRAYVTMLAGDYDEALIGAVGLVKGLKKVTSQYPLVVAVLPDVSEKDRKLLASHGCIVKEIEPVIMASYVTDHSKLRIWELKLEEYDKMIYLDVFVQVFENIDHMFDYPDSYFYATLDCFCEKSWSHSPQHKIGYCQQWPNMVQMDPTLGPKPPLYFNASMFVFEPSSVTYRDLVKTLQTSRTTAFAEQDLLNVVFKDKLVALAPHYNLLLPMLWRHPEAVELDRVKVVNYCANGSKPWTYTGKEENMEREDVKMLVNKWEEIYSDDSLDYKETLTSAEVEKGTDQVNVNPSEAAFSETGAVEFISGPSAA